MTTIASRLLPNLCAALCILASACKKQETNVAGSPEQTWKPAEWKTIVEGLDARAFKAVGEVLEPRFSLVDGPTIGVEFQNLLRRENIRNYLTTGAGLAVGDVDQNGLPDLFLVSQDGPNKLFKQVAPWEFVDATLASGFGDTGAWGSGAAFADIDNDGDLDLYVCNKNALDEVYLNQGDGTFVGNSFGNEDPSGRAPTMVSFSDFDLDGDLDFYRTETRLWSLAEKFGKTVNMVEDAAGQWQPAPEFVDEFEVLGGAVNELGTFDHLFRNEGGAAGTTPKFADVTKIAGIKFAREHGLAATWWDYNNDKFPDLYVSNDFHTPDHIYRNNQDGTFTETTEESLPYTSWSSMGSDFADVNNDGWFDYLSTDMSATTHFKQKTMMGAMVTTGWFLDNMEPRQYMRNALQVNTGTGKFIETAFFSGLDSTDWTWGGVFGDLDNDGLEDAFFSNGIERNFQDSDLSIRIKEAKRAGATNTEAQEILLASPRFKEKNLAYQNLGELGFKNMSEEWGLADETVSHGTVLADLDRDGDLDVVVNNMNDPVGIYRNNSSDHQAILISLRGKKSNHFGLGARITLDLEDGQTLSRMVTSSRGYMSGTEPVTHFGLGAAKSIKSLQIWWPSGMAQHFENLSSGFHYRITETPSSTPLPVKNELPAPLFVESKDQLGIDFKHEENDFDDFASQPLLPNRLSRFGPALAIADVNGDQRPDVFIGAAKDHSSSLYLQDSSGHYQRQRTPALEADQSHEDVAAVWFDSDGDGDSDLYVVSGGASETARTSHYTDRLYLNDGIGQLSPAPSGSLPDWNSSGSCVVPCDFDGDGDIDLFVGGRFVPGRYPTVPESSLLMNEKGKFVRVESPMSQAGLVTGAAWADLDGDARKDLVLATEWGPVRIFTNTSEGFIESTGNAGMAELSGWWTCVAAGDIDHDGDIDLIAGNFGMNTKYHVDAEHPVMLYVADFGDQGELQLVEAQKKEGKLLPVRGRSCSTTAMPHLARIAPTYTKFASLTLTELYSEEALSNANKLQATTLATTLFRNGGSGSFTAEQLPTLSQLAPVMAIAIADVDRDGLSDVVLGQNFNGAQRETGRMNAGLGVMLKGSASGDLTELWPAQSGLTRRTDTRQVIATDLNQDEKVDLIWGNNDSPPHVLLAN